MKKSIIFYSEGSKISGDLFLPEQMEDGKKYPAIVLCHGFAGIKEALLPPFAEAFSKEGFIALVFDYRGFGGSEGERGRLVPIDQVVDIRNALTFMESCPEVDPGRIGLWGTSLGGANVIAAASMDKRVKCLVVQLTFGNGERVVTGNMNADEKNKLMATLSKISQRTVTQNKQMMVGLNQILTDEDSKKFFDKISAEYPLINVKIPFLFVKHSIEYKPEELIGGIDVPIMIVAAENDKVNPPEESEKLFQEANGLKELVMIKGASHYEVYYQPKFIEAFDKEKQWFKKYL